MLAKKILFIATVDGHIRAFHTPCLKLFKENGWETYVAANSGTAESPADGRDLGSGLIAHCDHKYDIDLQRSPFDRRNISAYRQLSEIINRERFDIVHCHTPVGGVIGRLAARRLRRRGTTTVIYTAHGFHFYRGAPVLSAFIYRLIEKFLSGYTDILITINEEDYAFARDRFKTPRVYLVPGVGYDESRYHPVSCEEKKRLRREYGYGEDEKLLIFVAELNENKNQGLLIRALKKLKEEPGKVRGYDIRLLLAGEDSLRGVYQRLAKELGVSDMIDFLGHRDDADRLAAICDIALSSSLREGLPVNVMEAMACGLPVVATDVRGNRDLVEQGLTGYLVPRSDDTAADMARHISELLENREQLYLSMSDNALRRAKAFSRTAVFPKILDIYSEILK